ncbi:hypothetical protein [Ancylobacter sp. IITR112]|uniref:hypothetical protein n=1 Tax=Ancylobacter sp. IITR112 TaxID=3138073 RepID=UPI00352A5D4B
MANSHPDKLGSATEAPHFIQRRRAHIQIPRGFFNREEDVVLLLLHHVLSLLVLK